MLKLEYLKSLIRFVFSCYSQYHIIPLACNPCGSTRVASQRNSMTKRNTIFHKQQFHSSDQLWALTVTVICKLHVPPSVDSTSMKWQFLFSSFGFLPHMKGSSLCYKGHVAKNWLSFACESFAISLCTSAAQPSRVGERASPGGAYGCVQAILLYIQLAFEYLKTRPPICKKGKKNSLWLLQYNFHILIQRVEFANPGSYKRPPFRMLL